uniref:Reverse transcriptase RNase H-like domain-containing protein n=1 Tax=Caenorhabditis japonica TaxID=281687 RepID=A0A8R1IHT5_CAEJA
MMYRKALTGRLARFQILIQDYNIEIVYRPGKENQVADTLSRYHPVKINALESVLKIDLKRILEEQENDERIKETRNLVKTQLIQDGIIFTLKGNNEWVICLPPESKYGRVLDQD